MNIQARLSYRTARLQRKLFDNAVRKKSLDVRAIRLTIDEDRYHNKEVEIFDAGLIDIIISIPGGDLQAFNGERSNNGEYNSGVSVYNLLPIEAWCTNDAQLNKDDILIYKYLLTPYDSEEPPETKLQILQVVNKVSRATNTVLFNKYTLAPYTFAIDEYPTVKALIEGYQLEPIQI